MTLLTSSRYYVYLKKYNTKTLVVLQNNNERNDSFNFMLVALNFGAEKEDLKVFSSTKKV